MALVSIESKRRQLPFGGWLFSCLMQSVFLVAENPLTACHFLFVALPSCEVLSVVTACLVKEGVDVD